MIKMEFAGGVKGGQVIVTEKIEPLAFG